MAKYKSFTIHKYKGIDGSVRINLDTHGVMPIVGINESGKTSILQGMLAFDYRYDENNYGQLEEVGNILKDEYTATIEACISISFGEFEKIVQKYYEEMGDDERDKFNKLIGGSQVKGIDITVVRTINGNKIYKCVQTSFNADIIFKSSEVMDRFCKSLIDILPPIYYFDDFREAPLSKITYTKDYDKDGSITYLGSNFDVIGNLINLTYENDEQKDGVRKIFDILELADKNSFEKRVSTVVNKINRSLNKVITENWFIVKDIHGGNVDPLNLEIKHTIKKPHMAENKPLKESQTIEFIINVKQGDTFFSLSDRSKGFIWFFNFVMKTRLSSEYENSLFLLDEPGCCLHYSAQLGLSKVFKDLAKKNMVIFNTHSHYLLDYEYLPNTYIAYKNSDNLINLSHFSWKNKDNKALQPVINALSISSHPLDILYSRCEGLMIVEGIIDFYVWNKVLSDSVAVIPGTGKKSLIQVINSLLFLGKPIVAIFDADAEDEYKKLEKLYELIKYVNIVILDKNETIETFYDDEELKGIAGKNVSSKKSYIASLIKKGDIDFKDMPKTKKNLEEFYNNTIKGKFKMIET